MRVAVFADVHGNYEALDAVLKAVTYDSPDLAICLGDMVGYGPDPARCVERIRAEGILCLAGNHDHGVLGYIDETIFNYFARIDNLNSLFINILVFFDKPVRQLTLPYRRGPQL